TGFGATAAAGAAAGSAGAAGAVEGGAGAGAAVIIAFMTASLAPAFFRRTISSVLRSNICPLLRILAMIRSSEIPALINEITPSTVNPAGGAVPAVVDAGAVPEIAPPVAPDGVPAW